MTISSYNPLISGKANLSRVVNLEVENDKATLFIEEPDGRIISNVRKNQFWLLSNRPVRGSVKLEGSLYYQYGSQYSSKKDWYNAVQAARKQFIEVYTAFDAKEALMLKDGICMYQGMKHTEPSILSFDIESTGLFHNADSKVLLISNTFRKNGVITRKLFAYDEYETQGEMLLDWSDWVWKMNPSIIAGHNIYTYDLPYLQYIADKEGIKLGLGRDGSALIISDRASKFRVDGSRDQEYHKVRCYGRDIIDTMFLLTRWDIGRSLSSYALKKAISELGLERENREFYDASLIRVNYKNPEEFIKIKKYCENDADDSLVLFDKCIPAYFYMAQCLPRTLQSIIESAAGSQLNGMMIRSYLQDGHSIPKASATVPYQGALSAGIPGIYKNCLKWDVISEYPSIIRTYKVYDPDKDPKAHLIQLTDYFFTERLKYKKLYKETGNPEYDAIQNCWKVLANSLYGFLGSEGLQFNFPEGAAFITEKGRETVSIAVKWATSKEYIEWIKSD